MRILLADDQPKVRLGLRLLFEQEEWASVVGEAAEAESLLAQVEESQPDLVLFDWSLQDSAAAEQFAALRQACPQVAVIVLSAQPGVEEAALAAGADAFISKADPPEVLLAVIAGAQQDENTAVASTATFGDEQSQQNQIRTTGGMR
jgi:DNA-binding NarL/FixJ family response regulator